MKRLIKPVPTPSSGVRIFDGKPAVDDAAARKAYDKAAESLYFLELLLIKLGIDKNGKPMSVHAFTRKHYRV